jgi:hypothetical protein
MQDYSSSHRNLPEGAIPKSLYEFKVGGLRDSAPPPPVRVFKMNPDGTPGELIRVEDGMTFEHYKDTKSFNWGNLHNMSESDGSIQTDG